jgi:hypothetical protein
VSGHGFWHLLLDVISRYGRYPVCNRTKTPGEKVGSSGTDLFGDDESKGSRVEPEKAIHTSYRVPCNCENPRMSTCESHQMSTFKNSDTNLEGQEHPEKIASEHEATSES